MEKLKMNETDKKPEYLHNPYKCPCQKFECPRYLECDACQEFHHNNPDVPLTACERKAVSEGYVLSGKV
ncbi:MAG: hypothetical protein VZR23_10510 [Lachnospiraceae bacterium]|jgi:hypothetical protein|nr:hypothetical protein [Lachnospiraceae bacterium]